MKKLFIDKAAFSSARIVSSFARSGIWPFDPNVMRNKIALNANIASSVTSSTQPLPVNILQPRSPTSVSSTPPSSTTSSDPASSSSLDVRNTRFSNSSNASPPQPSSLSQMFSQI
ncbi:unnamed protein product, partial [Adineta ricciae]